MQRRRYTIEEKKEIIIKFIKNNPKTTYRKIKNITKLHPERIFQNGLAEAFKKAKIKFPRAFKIKTKEEKRKVLINYLRKNQSAGGHTIKKDTKINFQSIFKTIKELYDAAGIKYPRRIDKRKREKKKKKIIELIKSNPLITITELRKKTKTKPYNFFKNMKEIYKKAGISGINGHYKRNRKIKDKIIGYIIKNPLATQKEINQICKTHVQEIFKNGIFEAYEKARIKFPFERLKIYGTALKEIKKRARNFEDQIAIKLTEFGKVNKLIKTKRGVADVIFERETRKAIIEIKDYQKKDISISQINQLNKYLEDCNCNLGFLICHKKPEKDNFLIGKNKIFILNKEELNKIPSLMNGSVV